MGMFGIGQAPRRVEDQRLPSGWDRCRDDLPSTPGRVRRAIRLAPDAAAP